MKGAKKKSPSTETLNVFTPEKGHTIQGRTTPETHPTATTAHHGAQVVKCGYLLKDGGRIKTWKKRWFVLEREPKRLMYFASPEDAEPRGVIDLSESLLRDCPRDFTERTGRVNCFEVVQIDRRTYHFSVETEFDMLDWIKKLQDVMGPAPHMEPLANEEAHHVVPSVTPTTTLPRPPLRGCPDGVWIHDFISDPANHETCRICGLRRGEHDAKTRSASDIDRDFHALIMKAQSAEKGRGSEDV